MRTKSQQDRFRMTRAHDQHGRPWACRQEKTTGVPVEARPLFRARVLGNNAHVIPPAQYLRFNANEPGALTIVYSEWEADVRNAEARWNERLLEVARAMYGDGAVQAAENPSTTLLQAVGPKPIIPLDIVRAQAQGNQWALGLTDATPSWAAKYMERPATLTPVERVEYPDAESETESLAQSMGELALAGAAASITAADLDGEPLTVRRRSR